VNIKHATNEHNENNYSRHPGSVPACPVMKPKMLERMNYGQNKLGMFANALNSLNDAISTAWVTYTRMRRKTDENEFTYLTGGNKTNHELGQNRQPSSTDSDPGPLKFKVRVINATVM
jgi:hypothetical protein